METPLKRTLIAGAVAAFAFAACSDASPTPTSLNDDLLSAAAEGSSGVVVVTNNGDAGPGSFRDAVAQANADGGVHTIRFKKNVGTIALASGVTFDGTQDLKIAGRSATIDGQACACTALTTTGGGDLVVKDLTITGAPGSGMSVIVPAGATGVQAVELRGVTLSLNGLFGLHIDDQVGGAGGTGSDSGASIFFRSVGTSILGNGFLPGFDDFDGVRIDEGGEGSIEVSIVRTLVRENAGDGMEFDEKGAGDVTGSVRNSTFDENGSQPQLPSDLEDGFDVDEAGPGTIDLRIVGTTANNNFDEGIDLDEDGPGDIVARLTNVEAIGNLDEGIKFTEDEADLGGGSVLFHFRRVIASGNGDDGAQLEEFGPGDFDGRIVNSAFNENGKDGLKPEQADEGSGILRLRNVLTEGNADDPIDPSGVVVN